MGEKTIDDERFDRVKKARRKVATAKKKVQKAALGVAEAEAELREAVKEWQAGGVEA